MPREHATEQEPVATSPAANRPLPAAPHQVIALQRQVGNRATIQVLQRKGMLDYGVDWVKAKFSGEESLDEQIKTALERASTVFAVAAEAATLGGMTEETLKHAKAFGEAAEAFEKAAGTGEKLIKVKDYVTMFVEFKQALDEAKGVDLARDGEAGAKKLFDLMAAGGKIGKKVFPPPFDTYFDFISQFKNLQNVARPYHPDRKGGPHSDQWDQIEGYSR